MDSNCLSRRNPAAAARSICRISSSASCLAIPSRVSLPSFSMSLIFLFMALRMAATCDAVAFSSACRSFALFWFNPNSSAFCAISSDISLSACVLTAFCDCSINRSNASRRSSNPIFSFWTIDLLYSADSCKSDNCISLWARASSCRFLMRAFMRVCSAWEVLSKFNPRPLMIVALWVMCDTASWVAVSIFPFATSMSFAWPLYHEPIL